MDAEVRLPKAGEFVRECRHSHTGFAIWHNEDGRQCCTCLPAPKPNLLQPKKWGLAVHLPWRCGHRGASVRPAVWNSSQSAATAV